MTAVARLETQVILWELLRRKHVQAPELGCLANANMGFFSYGFSPHKEKDGTGEVP